MKTYVNEIVFRDDLRAVGAGIITLSGINGSSGISNSNGITSISSQQSINSDMSFYNLPTLDITAPFRGISQDVLGYNDWTMKEWKNPWTGTKYQSLNGSTFQTEVPEFIEGEGWILNGDTMTISRFTMGALDIFSPVNLATSVAMMAGFWIISKLVNYFRKQKFNNIWKSQGSQSIW